jgi:hypothetical protein
MNNSIKEKTTWYIWKHKLAQKVSRQNKTNQGMRLTSQKYVNVL